ncbi:hypothetical protein SSX86_003022 [Deinandra increscens subsp. villosa]|uniref:RRM domain-containing protein n=1 Tax=Deinandra increscens subsp. villosa TaxID=3103831 RepID=A0AAP0DGV8_9ASTR
MGSMRESTRAGALEAPSAREEEWCTIRRRRINNRLTYSFFIFGFPDFTTVDDVKMAVKHLGTISDVFIAKKRRFNNERFGFVRFKNIIDIQKVERRLNEVKIGDRFLRANLSHVPRNTTEEFFAANNHPQVRKTLARVNLGQ